MFFLFAVGESPIFDLRGLNRHRFSLFEVLDQNRLGVERSSNDPTAYFRHLYPHRFAFLSLLESCLDEVSIALLGPNWFFFFFFFFFSRFYYKGVSSFGIATGRNADHAVLCVTTGLMDILAGGSRASSRTGCARRAQGRCR